MSMLKDLLGGHNSSGEEAPTSSSGGGDISRMGDKVKEFFGVKPPSARQQLVDELRGALDLQPENRGFMSGVEKYTQSIRVQLGFEEQPEPSVMAELDQATNMTYKQRFYAFCISLGLGFGMSVLSWLFYFNTTLFAVTYTLGNFIALTSSAFFWGPKTYFSMMFSRHRWLATLAMLVMMAVTLAVVFTTGDGLLIMLCICVQSFCLFWYTISYIPFARSCVKSLLKKCFKGIADDGDGI